MSGEFVPKNRNSKNFNCSSRISFRLLILSFYLVILCTKNEVGEKNHVYDEQAKFSVPFHFPFHVMHVCI